MNTPPNILWISFEDCNPRYGCYGDAFARTPHLDRFAQEGCRWTHAFSTAGVCAPARSAVITGMYPISIGTHHMRTEHTHPATPELPTPYSAVVPHYVKCFTEYFRAAGYYCTNNRKTDYQFEPPLTAWDELGLKAHWRNRPDPRQPFFSVFNLGRTHESGMWPEYGMEPTFDPQTAPVPPTLPDTPEVRLALARVYTHIEYNDKLFGRLLAQLAADGLAENTLVFHWSDHGPLPRGKRWLYDSGLHVPLMARGPGLPCGEVRHDPVSTIDLAPTMLSLAGLDIPAHIQGRAFLGARAEEPRQYVFAARDRFDESYDMVRAVRDRRFKYIRNQRPELPYLLWIPYRNRCPILKDMWRLHLAGELNDTQSLMFRYPRPVEELYDTEADPHETRNLAADTRFDADRLRLRVALDAWLNEVGDMGRIAESEMVRQWYADGRQPRTAAPLFIPISADHPGVVASDGGCFNGPILLQLHCATQGASIAYTLEPERRPIRWSLYTQPLRLDPGSHRIRAKAVRIGYKNSHVREAVFETIPE